MGSARERRRPYSLFQKPRHRNIPMQYESIVVGSVLLTHAVFVSIRTHLSFRVQCAGVIAQVLTLGYVMTLV